MPSCLWGDDLGVTLANGASIPRYRQTKGPEEQWEAVEEEDRWEWLARTHCWNCACSPCAAGPPPEFDPRGEPLSQLLDERIRAFKLAPFLPEVRAGRYLRRSP